MELFTARYRAFRACRELPNHYQYTWSDDGTESRAEKAFPEPLYVPYTLVSGSSFVYMTWAGQTEAGLFILCVGQRGAALTWG